MKASVLAEHVSPVVVIPGEEEKEQELEPEITAFADYRTQHYRRT